MDCRIHLVPDCGSGQLGFAGQLGFEIFALHFEPNLPSTPGPAASAGCKFLKSRKLQDRASFVTGPGMKRF